MSEDEEKSSNEDEDLLSMVDALLDSTEEQKPKPGIKEESKETPKKTKVVPVIVRPPKKFKPRQIDIKETKDQIKPSPESIEPDIVHNIETTPKPPQKEEPKSELSFDELAETVLGEIDTELTTPEIKQPKMGSVKMDYKVNETPSSYEVDVQKKNIPSSYKIKFGTAKKLTSIKLDKEFLYVTCPKCKYYFESLEPNDIICPNCHYEFSV